MNETHDSLEAELAALRPHEVSPGLKQRLAEQLAVSTPPTARWVWRASLVGGLAAVCLAAILVARSGWFDRAQRPVVLPRHPSSGEASDSLPTLLVYSRTMARSPEELEALLEQHAANTLQPERQEPGIHVFTLPDVELHAWIGGL